jgi:hypothetical protein
VVEVDAVVVDVRDEVSVGGKFRVVGAGLGCSDLMRCVVGDVVEVERAGCVEE